MLNKNIFWIIGFPNSGKTLLAAEIAKNFVRQGQPVIKLDGDAIRQVLAMENSHFDISERMENARRIGRLATLIQQQGINVIVAANTFFKEVQKEHRKNLPGYYEIYLNSDEETRRARDKEKKLYSRFDSGEISNVFGLDLKADEPFSPDLILENHLDTDIAILVDLFFEAISNE